MSNKSFSSWYKSGSPWVWLNAGAVSISLVMVVGLLLLIAVRGLGHFWPADIMSISYNDPDKESITLIAEAVETEVITAARFKKVGVYLPEGQKTGERHLLKVGNRDYFG
jgi:phosphate transport system permease protein